MSDLSLPIIEGDTSQQDALQLMRDSGAAAIQGPDGFKVVTSRDVIDTPDALGMDGIADRNGLAIDSIGEIVGIHTDRVTIHPDRELPQFEVPAGYKQCPVNAGHTYDIDSPYTNCPKDGEALVNIYLND